MGYPRMMWDNAVEDATITADTEATGYPATNLSDAWRPYSLWYATDSSDVNITIDMGAGNTSTATALGFYNHNLGTCDADIELIGSNDNFSTSDTLIASFEPTDDKCCASFFSNTTGYRYFKISLTSLADTPYIGSIFIGPYLEFPVLPSTPFDPDAQEIMADNEINANGELLGILSEFSMRQSSWRFEFVPSAWTTDTFIPFYVVHKLKPFYWLYDYANYPTACYFMRFANKRMTFEFNNIYRDLSFDLIGKYES